MDDISRAAEVHDYRYGADRESLKDYTSTEVANRWKHKDIRRSQPTKDLRVAYPSTERNRLLNSKGPHKLLKAALLRSVTDDGKAGDIASQEWGGCAQREITSLPGNQ